MKLKQKKARIHRAIYNLLGRLESDARWENQQSQEAMFRDQVENRIMATEAAVRLLTVPTLKRFLELLLQDRAR